MCGHMNREAVTVKARGESGLTTHPLAQFCRLAKLRARKAYLQDHCIARMVAIDHSSTRGVLFGGADIDLEVYS